MTALPWLATLGVMLALQTATALLGRVAPTLAPVLMLRNGWTEGEVGALSAMASIGSVLFLLAGLPVLRHYGPVRCLQIGLAMGMAGVMSMAAPWPLALAGGLLIGLCFGPANSAGSEVLQRSSPPEHRNLVFSIKQTGVPIGGVLGGLLLPWGEQAFGVVAMFALVALLALGTIALLQPLRRDIDLAPAGSAGGTASTSALWRQVLSVPNLMRPLRALAQGPRLRRLGLSGAAMAFSQGGWFTFLVTYLTLRLHWSLAQAGAAFALMQVVSVVGRPLMGWLSDRLGNGVPVLRACGLASAATTLALALTGPQTPVAFVWLVVALAGLGVSSWNGVQLAEVARCAPGDQVSDTASGATLLVFCGYVASPAWVGACLALGGGFGLAFAGQALVTLACLPALHGIKPLPAQAPQGVASTQDAGNAPRL